MNYCPITNEELEVGHQYSIKGLKLLSPKLKKINIFPYSAEEQRSEAIARSSKLSIQGMQPKLSVKLNIKNSSFELVEIGGRYIFKPQTENYKNLPENENLTLHLAGTVGIEVPLHGLIQSQDKSLTYFIRRFDRKGQKTKVATEDFAQLSHATRDTKYSSTMEKVAQVIEQYCTFPALEKLKLFQRTLFSFLVGNEDMHLKNFSIIVRDDKIELSPAYDLLNSTIVIANSREELALPIRGRKRNLTKQDLFYYYAQERLGLNQKVIDDIFSSFQNEMPQWKRLIERSALPKELKIKYSLLVSERTNRIGISF